jgi:hypothetical protein
MALHDPIGVVSRAPGTDERQQHRLTEHEPMARPQVPTHPCFVDLEATEQAVQSLRHVMDEHR